MAYLMNRGFGQKDMLKFRIGPVLFYEHIYYFREVSIGQSIHVTLSLRGLSEDGMFFEFEHNIYGDDGTHHLFAELMGGMINLDNRKLTPITDDRIHQIFLNMERSEDFRWLTKEDTRKFQKSPRDRPDSAF